MSALQRRGIECEPQPDTNGSVRSSRVREHSRWKGSSILGVTGSARVLAPGNAGSIPATSTIPLFATTGGSGVE